ncbi:MAG: ATP-dependent zinc metalloprotease FtsH, partial [Oscillospiraceae bacterium]
QIILDDISTGASNDLERTTSIAKAMVTRYGFSEKLGNVVYGHDPQQTFLGRDYSQGQGYSEAVASEIDTEIRQLVDQGYHRCITILKENIDKLHIVAKILMTQEKITGDEFREIMSEGYVYVEPTEVTQSDIKAQEILEKAELVEKTEETTVIAPESEEQQ